MRPGFLQLGRSLREPKSCAWLQVMCLKRPFLSKVRLIFLGQLADCWETGITFSTSFHGSRVANCMLHDSGILWLLRLGLGLRCTPFDLTEVTLDVLSLWTWFSRHDQPKACCLFSSFFLDEKTSWCFHFANGFQSKAAGQRRDHVIILTLNYLRKTWWMYGLWNRKFLQADWQQTRHIQCCQGRFTVSNQSLWTQARSREKVWSTLSHTGT